MYLLVVGYLNGASEYYGPFPTEDRARQYAEAVEIDLKPQRWFVVPLIVPYFTVVQRIIWVRT